VKGLHGQIELQNTAVGDALVILPIYYSSFTNILKWSSFHEQKQYLSLNVLTQSQCIPSFVLCISSCIRDHIASILTAHMITETQGTISSVEETYEMLSTKLRIGVLIKEIVTFENIYKT